MIISKLVVTKQLKNIQRMHNLYAIFAKFLNICKKVAGKFSDLEILTLKMTSETFGVDNKSLLFAKLKGYKNEIPNLISRRQYNYRRKITSSLCNTIW